MMRVLFLILFFLVLPFAVVQGQNNEARSGTPYSSIAFGLPYDNLSPGTAGTGLTGVSIYQPYTANSVNPALWGMSPYTQGSVSFDLDNINARDGAGSRAGYRQYGVSQFQIVLPLVRSRFGASVGFHPVTKSMFSLSSMGSVSPGEESVDYLNQIEGSGGVNKLEAGFGYRLTNFLTFGYATSLHFSTLNREVDLLFASEEFSSLNYTERISGYAMGHRFGLYGRSSSLFGSRDGFAIGGAVSLPVSISTERSVSSFRNIGNQSRSVDLLPDGESGTAGEIEIPLEFNLGLTYNPVQLLDLTAEYQQQFWGSANYSHNPGQEQLLTDRTRMAFGARYHPYMREGEQGFLSGFRYGAGVSYDTGHLTIEDHRVETLTFHLGLGILSSRQASSVDLGFQLGFRGSEDQTSMIRETIWGIRLSVNLAEWMFRQTRFQ